MYFTLTSCTEDNSPLLGLGRYATQAVLTTILEYQRDGVGQTPSSLILRATLTVRTGNLRTTGDYPVAIALKDGGELIVHGHPPLLFTHEHSGGNTLAPFRRLLRCRGRVRNDVVPFDESIAGMGEVEKSGSSTPDELDGSDRKEAQLLELTGGLHVATDGIGKRDALQMCESIVLNHGNLVTRTGGAR